MTAKRFLFNTEKPSLNSFPCSKKSISEPVFHRNTQIVRGLPGMGI